MHPFPCEKTEQRNLIHAAKSRISTRLNHSKKHCSMKRSDWLHSGKNVKGRFHTTSPLVGWTTKRKRRSCGKKKKHRIIDTSRNRIFPHYTSPKRTLTK